MQDMSSTQNERPDCPPLSCVSMKSDRSKDVDTNLRAVSTQNERPDSPALSSVSMKSDWSKDVGTNFKVGEVNMQDYPAPSCVSIKSDRSKDVGTNFRETDIHPDASAQRKEQMNDDHTLTKQQNYQELSVFKDLEHNVIGFMRKEVKKIIKLLSHYHLESPCSEEEDEEDQTDASDGALKIAVHILRSMGQEILAQKLEKYGLFPRCQQDLKHRLSKKCQSVFEGFPEQGKSVFLEKIYTELYITKGSSAEVSTEHEVRQIEKASKRQVTKGEAPIKCADIFKPASEQDRPIRTVLTKGMAGIGKTLSVQKFILDWAEGNANQNIGFIFPLPFRELNLMKDKKYSFMDMIHHFFSETKGLSFCNQDRYKVVFCLDGLDESRFSLNFQQNECIYSVTEPASVDVLLTNLIKGNLLPFALVWITSRPVAANQIPPEYIDQMTEVRGFSDPQKEVYFRKRIAKLSSRVIKHLKSSRTLYIMCHIPVFCWMSATVLESILTDGDVQEIPTSLTEMYTHFLIIQTKRRNEKYGNHDVGALWNLKTILGLGKLAFQQLDKGNLIFYEEDLRECGIDFKEASVYSGVCTQIFKEKAGLYPEKMFCFVHLSFQEYLAALYVVLHFCTTSTTFVLPSNMPDKHQPSQLYSLFGAKRLHDLHQAAVDLALRNKDGHLDLFLRFLLGLSQESSQKLLQEVLPQTGSTALDRMKTVTYIKQKIRETPNPERCINLFHCLNELNDDSLVKEVQRYLKGNELRGDLSLSQLSALAFVLLMSDQELEEFNLGDYGGWLNSPARSDAGLLRMLPVVKASGKVELRECNFTNKTYAALGSALSSDSSRLKHLDLGDNSLCDSGLELLSTGLKHPNCKIETLELDGCNLKTCAALSSVLILSTSLKHLNLSNNDLGDSAMEHLSTGLEHSNCRLESLELRRCNLSEKSCATLSSALITESSRLRELDLNYNNLGDLGMELLSVGLKHPNCRLEKLELRVCNLTEKGCAALSSAMTSNSFCLRELELSENDLRDLGVELLSTGLEHPNCRLETLELWGCKLTEKSCATLSSVLSSSSSSLRHLDLSYNNLGDSGMKLLSPGLMHTNSKQEKLALQACALTEKSCVALSSVLKANSSSLRQLDLTHNYLGDSGVQLLSTGLQHPNCRLETLELQICNLTFESCSSLASALKLNPSCLRELDLRANTLFHADVVELSALQSDPQYSLTGLEY